MKPGNNTSLVGCIAKSATAVIIPAIIGISCSRIPDNVIQPDPMARLLVDIYKGESVIELQRSRFASDSMKSLLRQTIYKNHNVTRDMVDTSYVWYGRHIEEYLKVHDKAIEILEKDLAEETGKKIVFAEGDSIDIWPLDHNLRITPQSPTHIFKFNIPIDENITKGDNYNLKFKPLPTPFTLRIISAIFADYEDGTIEYKYAETTTDDWANVRFVCDSTKMVNAIYGYIYVSQTDSDLMLAIDSISLVRTRLQPNNYTYRYGQRRINHILPVPDNEIIPDSTSVDD